MPAGHAMSAPVRRCPAPVPRRQHTTACPRSSPFSGRSPVVRRLQPRQHAAVLDAGSLELVKEIPVGTGATTSSLRRRQVDHRDEQEGAERVARRGAEPHEVVKIPTSKPLPHGVAYSPTAAGFISQESVGIDPGAVDVIDLTTRARVATIPVRGSRPASRSFRRHDHTTTVSLPPADVLERVQRFSPTACRTRPHSSRSRDRAS